MTKTLFDYDYHVLPGDILLLHSTGWMALGNRSGQRALHPQRRAQYTHVALVINSTHIADAMPGNGVRIRSWKDAARDYKLNKCTVVRHSSLASLASDSTRLLNRIQFYYAQKYKIVSLARRKPKHNKGIVCSQFVALVMKDLGLPALASSPMQALPSDIDHNTREVNGWRQFPFSNYGLHPSVSVPEHADAYWKVLIDSVPNITELAGADDFAKELPLSVGGRGVESVEVDDGRDSSLDTNQQTTAALDPIDASLMFSEAIGHAMAISMGDFEAITRIVAELDRQFLGMAETLAKAVDQPDNFSSVISQEFLDGLSEDKSYFKISVRSLLERWHSLYIEYPKESVKTLADEDAPQRLIRHRFLLGEHVKQLTKIVTTSNTQAERLKNNFSKVAELFRRECKLPMELISNLHQAGSSFLKSMNWLEDELPDSIMARCDDYPQLVSSKLMPMLDELGEEVGQQALNQIQELLALDLQCYEWFSTSKDNLTAIVNGLASLPADS